MSTTTPKPDRVAIPAEESRKRFNLGPKPATLDALKREDQANARNIQNIRWP